MKNKDMLLYRFQPINKYTLENLILRKNWASNPRDFNDPFEFPLQSNALFNGPKVEYLSIEQKEIRDAFENKIKNYGVISYSVDQINKFCLNNQLLWAHYADKHKGMCLVFEIDENNVDQLFCVNYSEITPMLDFDERSNFEEVLRTKSLFWKYEAEYRQIFFSSNKHFEYPGKLNKIVFGCQANLKDIDIVFRLNESFYNSEVTFSKMQIMENSFLLSECIIQFKKGDKVPEFW